MFGIWPLNSKSGAILRELLYLRLHSSYQEDLGVYFHIIEVKDLNFDTLKTAILTVDL